MLTLISIIASDLCLCIKCLVLWRLVPCASEKKDVEKSLIAQTDGKSPDQANEIQNLNFDRPCPEIDYSIHKSPCGFRDSGLMTDMGTPGVYRVEDSPSKEDSTNFQTITGLGPGIMSPQVSFQSNSILANRAARRKSMGDSESQLSLLHLLSVKRKKRLKDYSVDREILDFVNERIILFDYSFQSIKNNVRSVQARSPSRTLARLFNSQLGPNQSATVENTFNDLEPISLICDYEVASKLSNIYGQVSSNILYERSSSARKRQTIPTITKIRKEFMNYDKNGTLSYDMNGNLEQSRRSIEQYEATIPFYEVIEL